MTHPNAVKPIGLKKLPNVDFAELAKDLDALYLETKAKVGEEDYKHIKAVQKKQRFLEIAGRTCLQMSHIPGAWLAGTGCLSVAKIMDNMELGHNVLHGQYDWTQDPDLNSKKYEWDIVCDSESWKYYHNYEHHTYTNIHEKDRDIGFQYIRVTQTQEWKWYHIAQVPNYTLLSMFFEWGVAFHALEMERVVNGQDPLKSKLPIAKRLAKKMGYQLFKDYAFFPALAGFNAPAVFVGNATANIARNFWTSTIIFCGHFPEGAETFYDEDYQKESKGQWYYRQLLGSCNIEGKPWLHTMSGHLSYQIEHHLFPDIPAKRYREMAPRVREICKKHGLPYNTGSFAKQYGSVLKNIIKYSFPNKKEK
ncbi:MAG TPA: acyl-CoA desaturase [Gammaproteobacteria bacterium]|mgnify:FL=1|nr:acyl-CoA desaturase [Gammaproteobacteria bacterium]|tara:strand:- start:451 stop:1542 length:1092 start_codon:yes stop_codon:yes gene_type:complete